MDILQSGVNICFRGAGSKSQVGRAAIGVVMGVEKRGRVWPQLHHCIVYTTEDHLVPSSLKAAVMDSFPGAFYC